MKKQILIEMAIPDELYEQCGEGYWNCVFAEWERQLNDFKSNLRLSDPHYREFMRRVVAEVVASKQ